MRIAYIIMAHDQPELFGRLVAALDAPGAQVFAHIDAKSDEEPFRAAAGTRDVAFVTDRVRVHWGGFSQIEATLRLLRTARAADDHGYYIFLSGRDYPIKGNRHIADRLQGSDGVSYMNFYPLVGDVSHAVCIRERAYYDAYAGYRTKLQREAVKLAVSVANRILPGRGFIPGYTPYRGSSSWCLSGQVVDYILGFVDNVQNRAFIDFFQSTACGDEIFFQTIVLNSPLARTCKNYQEDILDLGERTMADENKVSLHYIDWDSTRENPAILNMADWKVLSTSDKLFARKFDLVKSAELLDSIDELRKPTSASPLR